MKKCQTSFSPNQNLCYLSLKIYIKGLIELFLDSALWSLRVTPYSILKSINLEYPDTSLKTSICNTEVIQFKLEKHSAHACSRMEFIFLLVKLHGENHGVLKKYKIFVKVNAISCYVLFTLYYFNLLHTN